MNVHTAIRTAFRSRFARLLPALVVALLLSIPAWAGDDVTVLIARPMVGSAGGSTTYGSTTWDQLQSARDGTAVGLEYRHSFNRRYAFQLDYDRTSTNATFQSLVSNSSVTFPVARHEISGAFIRYFGPSESRLRPFFNVGPGILLFDGGYAPGGDVGWSASPEAVLGCGVDTPLSKHLAVRTGFRFHIFRNTNYGDSHFHAGVAHIQEPIVGLGWKF